MKKFSYQDYKMALKDAGPKLADNILERAANDPNITFEQHKKLVDFVYPR